MSLLCIGQGCQQHYGLVAVPTLGSVHHPPLLFLLSFYIKFSAILHGHQPVYLYNKKYGEDMDMI